MTSELRTSLIEGLADAAGFVLGAMAGWGAGLALGIDFVTTPGYAAREMLGLVLIVLGCGVGKWLARRLVTGAARRP